MQLTALDWLSVVLFFVVSLGIGAAVSRRAGTNTAEYFAAGRSMPWWLLGISMVATTFSTDTPNLVTDIVRTNGVAGNWVWWAFLLTGMLTTFVYAQLWVRSGVLTDIEFYELRYSGKGAAFLRGFRALYLGVFFNVLIMASVTLAAIKIGGVLLGLPPLAVVAIAGTVTVVYSVMGGLRGVIFTDFIQFILAMIGAIGAAYIALNLPEVGGLANLISHPDLDGKLGLLPSFNDTEALVALLIVPLAVQWWAVWYPGSEPGGGGYVAQRMLSARNEDHAIGATFLFQAAHHALRPWPWILVALASLLVFPDLASLEEAFPHMDPSIVRHDMAYPAMLTFLPAGLLGLVVASLIAAYMSTISTHLNWGSSYIVNDFYRRFLNPQADERTLVRLGRITTAILMVLAAFFALLLENALDTFQIMLQVGAGTGLLFILRWFWWRINAASEITAMVVSFVLALYFRFGHTVFFDERLGSTVELLLGVGLTTVAWVIVTLLVPPSDTATLRKFYRLTQPGGPGWRKVVDEALAEGESLAPAGAAWNVPQGILCMVLGCAAVYGTLFGVGYLIYGQVAPGVIALVIATGAAFGLTRAWRALRGRTV